MAAIVGLISIVLEIFVWIVVVSVLLSYFMSPYHPVRQALDRIVDPLLAPIRRIVPSAGPLDFSPMILILVLWLIRMFLLNILSSL